MGREEAGLKAAGRAVPGLRELLVAWSPAAGVQGKSCQHSPVLVLCCALLGPGTRVFLGYTPQRSSKAKKGVPEGVMHAHIRSYTFTLGSPRAPVLGMHRTDVPVLSRKKVGKWCFFQLQPARGCALDSLGKASRGERNRGDCLGGSKRRPFSWKRQGEMAQQMSS